MHKITYIALAVALVAVGIAVYLLVAQNGQKAGTVVTQRLTSTPQDPTGPTDPKDPNNQQNQQESAKNSSAFSTNTSGNFTLSTKSTATAKNQVGAVSTISYQTLWEKDPYSNSDIVVVFLLAVDGPMVSELKNQSAFNKDYGSTKLSVISKNIAAQGKKDAEALGMQTNSFYAYSTLKYSASRALEKQIGVAAASQLAEALSSASIK